MSEHLGSFCLVLHGHMPYVLRHGTWPHGEDWLYEAALGTYLPILDMVGRCEYLNAPPRLTLGLTPVLIEQLSHPVFQEGLVEYVNERIQTARDDRAEFESERVNNGHLAYLAQRWEDEFTRLLQLFEDIDRDIPKAFTQFVERGHLELLTSFATHGYAPLLYEDSSIRAQMRAGLASSERVFGYRPTGMWLPECAYRPGGPWYPPNHWGGKDYRVGVEHLVADEGITHCFVENHLIEHARSEMVHNGEDWHKVDWDEASKYASRGWRSVNEVHGVNSDGNGPGRVGVFARDRDVTEAVWSGDIGYPADGAYLEFHKKWGPRRGLRYWKVTGPKVDLGDKHLYVPDDISGRIFEHVSHFIDLLKSRLWAYKQKTGRQGVVVATFDAELFGHWWYEGPRFLQDLITSLNADPAINLTTCEDYLKDRGFDKTVAMPEGSWGDGGDHRVWTNDQVDWMWDIEYRCEYTFNRLRNELPWRDHPHIHDLLQKAGRELLLLQASDWPFVIRRGQAVDYGIKRYMQHVARFENLCDLAEKCRNEGITPEQFNEIERFEVQDAELHDIVFPKIDLDWWQG